MYRTSTVSLGPRPLPPPVRLRTAERATMPVIGVYTACGVPVRAYVELAIY